MDISLWVISVDSVVLFLSKSIHGCFVFLRENPNNIHVFLQLILHCVILII